jgi:hypothetical protein
MKHTVEHYLGMMHNQDLAARLKKLRDETTFKHIPAAVKYHHHWRGGFDEHIAQVTTLAVLNYQALIAIYGDLPDITLDDVILVSIIHDLYKLHRYKLREWKKPNDPPYDYDNTYDAADDTGYTVWYCAKYDIELQPKHLNALTYHHGGWTDRERAGVHGNMNSLATIVAAADMLSGKILGNYSRLTDS